MQIGDQAPLAHQDTRQFPDWYKPYSWNYHGDGYMALFFAGMLVAGYSYMSDICEQKGRRSRKIFESDLQTNAQKVRQGMFGRQRLQAGDAEYEKFTHTKERAVAHH